MEQQVEIVNPIPPIHVDTVKDVDGMEVYQRVVLGGYSHIVEGPKAAEVVLVGRQIPDSFDRQYMVRTTYWVGIEEDGVPVDVDCDSFRHALVVYEQQLQRAASMVR